MANLSPIEAFPHIFCCCKKPAEVQLDTDEGDKNSKLLRQLKKKLFKKEAENENDNFKKMT